MCKCLDLFDCSQATSGTIVACEEVLVYSTMINQRAREKSEQATNYNDPRLKNQKEEYFYPQLNIIQSVTMVTVNKGDVSLGDVLFFHSQAFNHLCLQGSCL